MASESRLRIEHRFPIDLIPRHIPSTSGKPPGTVAVVTDKNLPVEGFLNRSDERTLVSGVLKAADRTEKYIQTPKLRDAIKRHVDDLIEKYNDYIMGLFQRINELQEALRQSDAKLALANEKLVALFGATNRDNITDDNIRGLFDEWDLIKGELDTHFQTSGVVDVVGEDSVESALAE